MKKKTFKLKHSLKLYLYRKIVSIFLNGFLIVFCIQTLIPPTVFAEEFIPSPQNVASSKPVAPNIDIELFSTPDVALPGQQQESQGEDVHIPPMFSDPNLLLTVQGAVSRASVIRDQLIAHISHSKKTDPKFNLIQQADKDNVFVYGADESKGEVTFLKSVPIHRVVDKKTKLSIIFIEEGSIDPSNTLLEHYISRQHLDAGRSELNGGKGRDVVIIWYQGDSNTHLTNITYFPRPKLLSLQYWKEWYRATLCHKQNTISLAAGFGFAGVFVVLNFLITSVDQWMMNPSSFKSVNTFFSAFNMGSIINSAIWSGSIALVSKSYRQFFRRGTLSWRVTKQVAHNILYGYSLNFFNSHFSPIYHPFDPVRALVNWTLLMDVFLYRIASIYWTDIPKILSEGRNHINDLTDKETALDKDAIMTQTVSLIPFSFRHIDLLIHAKVFGVPIGKVVMTASIPLAPYIAIRIWKKLAKNASSQAEKDKWLAIVKREEERLKLSPLGFPMSWITTPVQKTKTILKRLSRCQNFLMSQDTALPSEE